VYRRSLFQRPQLRTDCSIRRSGPQGPRRPRFSFFRFTCQTARDQGGPLPESLGEPSKPKPPTEIGGWSPSISEELRRRVIAPRRRRTVWPYIGPPAEGCQHRSLRNLTSREGVRYDLYVGRKVRFARPPGAALQPHSSDEVRGLGASRGTGTDRALGLTIWVVDRLAASSRGPPVNGGGAACMCRV
jgi:hypothetical protein